MSRAIVHPPPRAQTRRLSRHPLLRPVRSTRAVYIVHQQRQHCSRRRAVSTVDVCGSGPPSQPGPAGRRLCFDRSSASPPPSPPPPPSGRRHTATVIYQRSICFDSPTPLSLHPAVTSSDSATLTTWCCSNPANPKV